MRAALLVPRLGAAVVGIPAVGGCGLPPSSYPHALTNEQGQPILLDDVTDVLDDDSLSDGEKRDALRDLGIEDEKLIDALVSP